MSDRNLDTAETGAHGGLCRRLSGRLVSVRPFGSLVWLTLEIPGWPSARPGQFALLQPEFSRCFLARAFSIADEQGERVSFMISPLGEGTHELCRLSVGDSVWILGPLGNGFDMDGLRGASRLVVVAGGVGVAPFPLLLSRLAGPAGPEMSKRVTAGADASAGAPHDSNVSARIADDPKEIVVLLGFRDASQALGGGPVTDAVSRLQEAGRPCRAVLATEDGSRGPAQKVTDVLARELLAGDRLLVCGPSAMLSEVWRVCCTVPDVRAWFSLEAGMACGVGSCHGCAIVMGDGSLARVCQEGPVFAGERVFGSPTHPSAPAQADRVRP